MKELYVRCFTRRPTEEQVKRLLELVRKDDPAKLQQDLEDVFWALMNSNEFIFNH